ncbi:MAG TPA: M28 family peptidase [Solirubrobacteraceae bacterium]|nr:M28 family peptidase [Solirubrobacteraceae bacterium]
MTGTIADDVRALAGMSRGSASAGERAAAEWAAGRLAETGVADVALEPYRWPRTHAWAHLPHLAAAATGSRLLAAAALVSYELDQSGRAQWVQRLLPKGEGMNVVGRIAPRGEARRTLVLVAHLDAQRAGLMWDRRIVEAGARRRLRTRSMTPAAAPPALAIALRWRPLLALVAAFVLETAARPPVPGANDNASGVAAVLEAARRLAADPLDRTEVLAVLPGAEEAGMGGMRAFLRDHALDPATTFVLGLDTVGSGTPILAAAEGALLPHRYREQDLALVERAAAADPPQRWRIAAYTDPILARFAGLPAASILSVGEHGMYTRYHRPDDLPEHVDLACVERCAEIAERVGRALDAG